MGDTPIDSIQKIIDYMWKDEGRHFSEQSDDDLLRLPHIFHDVVKVKTWLEEMTERAGL